MNFIKVRPIVLAFLSLFSCLFSNSKAEEILAKMSLEEKIGQLFMAPLCPKRQECHFDDIRKLIDKYHIGGFIVKQSDPLSQINALNFFQSRSLLPLIISADAEWGLAMRMENTISYPKNIYLGKLKDDSLLSELGMEIGRQLRLVGVHINLAPVVDVNNNPKNIVIKERVFGSDPYLVAKKAKAIVLGMQSQNVLCTAKHFPGYGDIETDPHFDLPSASHALSRLHAIEFIPYKALIENNIGCIMTAHIILEKLDVFPAAMSEKITQDILRKELKFEGLIITDALNMKALTNIYSIEKIALMSHMAGNDILLYGDHINPNIDDILNRQIPLAFEALKQAYLSGELDIEKLDGHVLRILKTKENLGLFEDRYAEPYDEDKLNSGCAYRLKEQLEQAVEELK